MENYYTLLTSLSDDKIAKLLDGSKTHPKEAKVLLGKTIVTDFYNEATAQSAAAEFEKVFAQKQLPDEMPEVEIGAEVIAASKLVLHCGLVESGGEAKRMIKNSAVSIDDKKVNDPNEEITPKDNMVIKVGKRRFARLRVE